MTKPETRALRDRVVAAIRSAPFKELRTVDGVNGPLQITALVDDLADAVVRAVSVPPPAPRADDQTALRDRIADALARLDAEKWGVEIPAKDHPFWQMYPTQADAVLAVLPEPVDRATVLREAAGRYEEILANANTGQDPRYWTAVRDITLGLRAMAIEAPTEGVAPDGAVDLADGPVRCPLCVHTVTLHTPNGARAHFTTVHPEQRITGRGHGPWPLLVTGGAEAQSAVSGPVAGEQQNETPEADGCWCGHPKDRHWAGSTRMTFPDGCHDCRGWNGAHGYGQELPWLPEGDEPAAGVRQDEAQP